MIDRNEYRKTFLYALRRLGKAVRHLNRTIVYEILKVLNW